MLLFLPGELSLRSAGALGETVVDFNSTQKCEGGSGNMQTSIAFLCGKTMVGVRAGCACHVKMKPPSTAELLGERMGE